MAKKATIIATISGSGFEEKITLSSDEVLAHHMPGSAHHWGDLAEEDKVSFSESFALCKYARSYGNQAQFLRVDVEIQEAPLTRAYLDVSMLHIQPRTSGVLDVAAGTNKLNLMVAAYEYGFFVSVPSEPEYSGKVPQDIRKVLDFARQQGADVVRLDRDGDEYAELDRYDW